MHASMQHYSFLRFYISKSYFYYNCLYKTTIRKSARSYIVHLHMRTVQNNSIQSLDWTGHTGLPLKLKIQPYNGILVPTCTYHICM